MAHSFTWHLQKTPLSIVWLGDMGKYVDLIGQSKNHLTIIGFAEKDIKNNRIMWKALCKCGKETKVCTGDWNANRAKSCGCFKSRKGTNHPNFVHGLTRTAEYSYKLKLKTHYGIDYELYQLMFEMQNGKCAICNRPPKKQSKMQKLSVDHCHYTSKIRGLLCNTCNRGIGFLQDSSKILNNAFNYLKRNEVNNVFN